LAGGVGGAKLADGLYRVVPSEELAVIVNTADDLTLFGLRICPDLDTVMYTLAGLANPQTGWGLAGDTFRALEMLGCYGEATWFRLGDQDLATHLARTRMLAQGQTLTQVTQHLAERLGVQARLLPMCDEPVATLVDTPKGQLSFQDYFVQGGGQDRVLSLRYEGIHEARLGPAVQQALERARLIVLCPSNPLLSMGPILSVPGLRDRLRRTEALKVAVSPLVGGKALRGPLVRLLQDLGYETNQETIARFYKDFLDILVLDHRDRGEAEQVEALGIKVAIMDTVMNSVQERESLARQVLELVAARKGG
jgi:LPPG:FO 2-phospho-L-lactate transferase